MLPTLAGMEKVTTEIYKKVAPVIASAISGKADFFVTRDKKNFNIEEKIQLNQTYMSRRNGTQYMGFQECGMAEWVVSGREKSGVNVTAY